MSHLGITTYAKPTTLSTAYQEGKAAVTELFQQQTLVDANAPGLFQPHAAMLTKLEDAQRQLVSDAYADVIECLTRMKPALERVAEELSEQKELNGNEVVAIYDAFVAESSA